MIITDRFVFLNFPKAASIFVSTVLSRIHTTQVPILPRRVNRWINRIIHPTFRELFHPNMREFGTPCNILDHHGIWLQIPDRFKNLPVLMVVRNPLDRYISEYFFRWWANHPITDERALKHKFPNFPNFDFAEYLDYKDFEAIHRLNGIPTKTTLGCQTVEFIRMASKKPDDTFRLLDYEYVATGRYRDDLPEKLILLSMENINIELYAFLIEMGYKDSDIRFLINEPKRQPVDGTVRGEDDDVQTLYNQSLIASVKSKDQLLYKIYNDFNIQYD